MKATWALFIALLLGSSSAFAGYVASGATIARIANTTSNTTSFAVYVTGGSGPCTNGAWITFPVSAAADLETHKKAYATAMMALAMGFRVSIHNYSSDSCDLASYIEVYS